MLLMVVPRPAHGRRPASYTARAPAPWPLPHPPAGRVAPAGGGPRRRAAAQGAAWEAPGSAVPR
jgi:hypothetical protein